MYKKRLNLSVKPIYERQDDESMRDYNYFCKYRDSLENRTVKQVIKVLKKGKKTISLTTISKMCSRNQWRIRASEYDSYLNIKRRFENEDYIRSKNLQHLQILEDLTNPLINSYAVWEVITRDQLKKYKQDPTEQGKKVLTEFLGTHKKFADSFINLVKIQRDVLQLSEETITVNVNKSFERIQKKIRETFDKKEIYKLVKPVEELK